MIRWNDFIFDDLFGPLLAVPEDEFNEVCQKGEGETKRIMDDTKESALAGKTSQSSN